MPVGDSVMVQVFAHGPDEDDEPRSLAAEFNGDAGRRAKTALGTEITRGSRLTFGLLMPRAEVSDPIQELVWRGRTEAVQFAVTIPASLEPCTLLGTVHMSQDNVPIGHVTFKLLVVTAGARLPASQAGEGAARYEQAFISYARQDLQKVTQLVQLLPAVGLKYRQDVFDLDPGEEWWPVIAQYIDDSDLFLLFWSSAARESEWVTREWRRALSSPGQPHIRPVPIEGPPVPPPPQELSHLHFGSRAYYLGAPGPSPD